MRKIKTKSGSVFLLFIVLLGACKKEKIDSVEIRTVNLEDLSFNALSFWNGSDQRGKFQSSEMTFENNYNTSYGSWEGFVYSAKNDVVQSDYTNQYSVFDARNGKNKFALYYPPYGRDAFAKFLNDSVYAVKSLSVCNSTYTALTMKLGDPSFAKKFGGESGNDLDWFKMTIVGYNLAGDSVHSIDFYLADFRFSDNSKDYIINNWTNIDLTPLGKINKMTFRFSSSDNGDWGMNTPAYVCLDNLKYEAYISILK